MKKALILLLSLVLLLSGCKKTDAPQPTEPETTGLYDPNHAVEQLTGGAVRAYPLGDTAYTELETMGNKLLLWDEDGSARVLQGENCEVAAEAKTGLRSRWNGNYDIHAQGVAVYEESTKEVVLLNPQLQEVNRIALPADMQGMPAISMESGQIFYCQGTDIRAMDMESGIPRLIRSHPAAEQTLLGCYFDGKLIGCQVTDAKGERTTLLISSEDGAVRYEEPGFGSMESYGDRYFIRRFDNGWYQCIAGNLQDGPKSAPAYDEIVTEPVLEMNGLVVYITLYDSDATVQFIDLAAGTWTSRLTLPGIESIKGVAATEEFVWLLVQEENGQALYRWDVTLSQNAEATMAMAPLYTADSPDTEGIAKAQARADELGETYGVKISLWLDALKYAGDYQVEGEYLPQALDNMLLNLHGALMEFPEGFLKDTIRSGDIRICLVRSIADAPWVVNWVDGDCVILISSGAHPGEAFLEAVGTAVDSHVLGNSRDYDNWEKLNPEGFTYGAAQQDESLLRGETRAFADKAGMASVTEDRRTLFYAAMGDKNEKLFESEIMQAKLRCMCEGIREAYGLEKSKDTYPWEFYLNEPMVKMEKS